MYGDNRDSGPRAAPVLSGFSRNSITQNFTNIFGWQSSWRHQHGSQLTLEFPSWYWERNAYWDTALDWRIRPDWAGAAPIRILDPVDSRDEVKVEFQDLLQNVLLDGQQTDLRARVIRESINSPIIARAYLYGNDSELLQIDVPFSNDTVLNLSFNWQVVYSF